MKYVSGHVFLFVMTGLLAACSGSFNMGNGGGGSSVTAGNFFSPAVKSSAMDQDLVYNINFINNLVIQDLCNGDASSCDPSVADVLALLDSYDITAPESILNGEFSLPNSGSAIAMKMSAKAAPIADYCSVPAFQNINVTVNGSTVTLAAYFSSLKRMDNGSHLKICEIMNLREDLKSELKLSVAAQNGYLMSDGQISETLRLRARREFLYVFVNTFLAFGTDLIGFCQWAGCTVDTQVAGSFASSADAINEGINKNKYNVRPVEDSDGDVTISTREFFDSNKGNTYLFIEQFFSRGEVINAADAIVKYSIDEANFCKFVVGTEIDDTQSTTYDSQQYDDNLSECMNAAHEYFSRLSFVQKANGEKSVQAIYTDSLYLNSPVRIFNLKYSINYNSLFEIILEDLKKAALAFMQHELDHKPAVAAELSITPEKVDTLRNITLQGSFGIGAAVSDVNESQSIEDSLLPAQVFASVTKELYVLIPETVSEAEVDSLTGNNSFYREEAGDVSYRMAASDKTVRIEHKRGQSLYQDILGLNFLNVDLRFPPYKLTSADFFIFDLSVDELDGDFKIEKPVALSKFEINKNGTLRNYLEMSNLDLTFKSVATTTATSKSYQITEAFGPAWNLDAKVDADSLTTDLKDLIAQQSGGMVSSPDVFSFQMNAPQGSYFKSTDNQTTNLWFDVAPDTGAIKPLNLTLTGTIASTTKTVGPYSLSDEGASFSGAMSSVMTKLMSEFPGMQARAGGSFTGDLNCGADGLSSASITLTRTYSSGAFNQTITDFSMQGSQILSNLPMTGTYGPIHVNTASYTHWDSSTYDFQYAADADNIVQSISVIVADPNFNLNCSGVLTRN